MRYQYKATVILYSGNDSLFLQNTIDGVTGQSIGFEENVQLILVHDGTRAGVSDICSSLAARYHDNIKILESSGIHSGADAINAALPFIRGEFVNYLEPGLVWAPEAFKRAIDFAETFADEIDCVFCPRSIEEPADVDSDDITSIESASKIVDVTEGDAAILIRMNTVFVSAAALMDVEIGKGSDNNAEIIILTQIVSDKGKYGQLVEDDYYEYLGPRDRETRVISRENAESCLEALKIFEKGMNDLIAQHSNCSKYIQSVAFYMIGQNMYDRIDFGLELKTSYINELIRVLNNIEDEAILSVKSVEIGYKIFALRLKHEDFYDSLKRKNKLILYNDSKVYSFGRKNIVKINIMDIRGNTLYIYGQVKFPFDDEDYDFYFETHEGQKLEPVFDQKDAAVTAYGDTIYKARGFSLALPIEEDVRIRAYIKFRGSASCCHLKFEKYARLSDNYEHSYYRKRDIVVTYRKKWIIVKKTKDGAKYEKALIKELQDKDNKQGAFMRKCARAYRWWLRKRGVVVWLFADRYESADDNGEFMYKYVQEHKPKNVRIYYVMTEGSRDYGRLKKECNVLIYKSFKYMMNYLAADLSFISVRRLAPILKYKQALKDHYPKTIYLQHGIAEKDCSDLFNRLRVNDRVYLTSTIPEYENVLKYQFGYTEREVRLLGMPRHDLLFNMSETKGSAKRICIAPTWRYELSPHFDSVTEKHLVVEEFRESLFYKFYNGLMNDSRVLKAMKEKGYKGVLQLHPYFIQNAEDFEANEVFHIKTEEEKSKETYSDQFKGTELVITDYSSIAHEYAMMGKAVIYTQFDKESFYANHTYEPGYFDYERDGFGPVCYDYESTVQVLLDAIENDCRVEEKYAKRKEAFFGFLDGKCCERILKEALKIQQEP